MMDDNRNAGDGRAAVGAPDGSAREHVLLTVLGKEPRPARYHLEGCEVEAGLAALALYELLAPSDRPKRVAALCTPEAERDSWPLLETKLGDRCRTELVRVCGGETPEEINTFMEQAAKTVVDADEITVDVTHGFRHFSFLTCMVALYVSALRGVRVRGAYYGLLRESEPSPFLDLRGLLELPRWLHALRALNETGSARPMASLLREGSPKPLAEDIAKYLTRMSDAYLSGFPLELGRQAGLVREHRKPLRKLISDDCRLPLGNELAERIDGFLAPFALASAAGDGWKGKLPLTECELKRQAWHIDDLLERGHVAAAIGLMSEWTVSWVLWARGPVNEWLDYRRARLGAANLLDATEAVGKTLAEHLSDS